MEKRGKMGRGEIDGRKPHVGICWLRRLWCVVLLRLVGLCFTILLCCVVFCLI
jgi:hypothetical protein